MGTQIRFLLALLATCGSLGIVCACQAATSEPEGSVTSATTSVESKDASISGVSGTIIAESDVGGQPDTPLAQQVVALIPLQVLQTVAGSAQPLGGDQLRFLSVSIQEGHPDVAIGLTDADGQYALAASPGEYALCLADSEGAGPASLPLVTRGCGRVVVEPGKITMVDVSSGFREILLSRP